MNKNQTIEKSSDTEIKIINTITQEEVVSLSDLKEQRDALDKKIESLQSNFDEQISNIQLEVNDIQSKIDQAEALGIKDVAIDPIAVDPIDIVPQGVVTP